jgi:predicted nucleic acid-binding protein
MNAVDTNVLLYVHDPRDPVKQAKAAALVQSLTNAALLWQVACEYIAASHKLEPLGFRREDAWKELRMLQLAWTQILPQWKHLSTAESLLTSHSLSFWDALLIAVAAEEGVTTLYSEDFTGLPPIGSLTIVNPFAP